MSCLDSCCVDNPRGKYSKSERPHEHEDHEAGVTERLKKKKSQWLEKLNPMTHTKPGVFCHLCKLHPVISKVMNKDDQRAYP